MFVNIKLDSILYLLIFISLLWNHDHFDDQTTRSLDLDSDINFIFDNRGSVKYVVKLKKGRKNNILITDINVIIVVAF